MPASLAALLNSRFAREGERKHVTVLFADIRGSTELIADLDPELAMRRLDPGLQAMAKAVHHYGGTVTRLHGDGIMALFGAPLAYEDHALRACFAARAMIDAVAHLGDDYVDIRIGLNSGEVVVRSIGHDLSMEYDAHGRTTHVASRLEQLAAPGTVCISAQTARLTAGFITVRSRGPFQVKGIAEAIEVFELTGVVGQSRWQVRAAAHSLSRFVGRQTEIRVLLDALRRTRDGRGQIVAVAGEAGMGKSRLLHEFLLHPEVDGILSLRGAAMPHDQSTPYQLVATMLRAWLNVGSQDSRPEIEAKLVGAVEALRSDDTISLAALRSLLDLPIPDGEWSGLDTARRRQITHDAVRAFVLQTAETAPFIIVIEDMHWADFESQSVLESIIDSLGAARLMVIMTYRPEYHNRWTRLSYHSLVQLGPLENAACDQLLRSLLGDVAGLDPLRRRMIEQTDGTPLFLEEMVHTLIETGVLVSEPTEFRLTRCTEDIEIPASVQIVLASRIDRLPIEQRTLLQIASVIGKDVPVALLRRVANIPADQLARQLLDLRSLEFLHEIRGVSGTEYTFKHALTHDVAYDSMLLRHRRVLHADVLLAIEDTFPNRIDEFTERLADHAVRGEVWDKAVAYCHKAGQRANNRSAHRAATAFFEHALVGLTHLAETPDSVHQAIEIRLGLRVALLATGELLRVKTYLQEAEALAESIRDERRLAPILISKSTILNNLGDLDEALRDGLQGRMLAECMLDEAGLVSSGYALGQAYWNRGEFQKAEAILAGIVGTATGENRPKHSGTTGTTSVLCLVSLSHTLALVGRLDEAFARSRESLEIAMETERPYDLSYAQAAQGLAHLTAGELDHASRHLEEALRIARGNEIMLLIPHAARYLGRAYALAGRLDEAHTLLVETVAQAKAQSLLALHGWCSAALGLERLRNGASDTAAAPLTEALEFARARGYRPLQVHALRLLGLVAIAGAEDTIVARAAEMDLRAAATQARDLGMRPELAHCHHGLAQLFIRTGKADAAQTELAQAIQYYHACGMKNAVTDVRSTLANMARGAQWSPMAGSVVVLG